MKVIVNYSEIKATLRFIEELDPISYGKSFANDDTFDSIEKCVEAITSYNEESEGLITLDINLYKPEFDEKRVLLRDKFRDEDEFVMTMDSELYSRYCKFLSSKLRPVVKLVMAVVDFIESFSDDAEAFFKDLWFERKLKRLEKENEDLKAKVKNESSEKEAQDQLADKASDEESVEEFIAKCEAKVDEVSKKGKKS